jgi:hypothetical protein
MERPTYTFKIGQQVAYYAGGRTHRKRTGPFTVVALVRQPDGVTKYRIKSRTHEHLALADELRLVLPKTKLSPE